MIEFKTKEHLLHYFLNHTIRLSNYDQKFLNNLEHLISRFNRITTNQALLFDKLISKYSKQFTKVGFIKEDLKQLPWTTPVVESTPEYTGAQVSMVGDKIKLKVPFNKNFISVFRTISDNSFEWDRNNKEYTSPLNTYALKILDHILPKHFSVVRYSDDISNILEDTKKYNAKFWNPTYVKINNRYYVVAVTPFLYEHINDTPLDDDPKTLFTLSQLGIDIDETLTQDDPKKRFAGDPRPCVELDNLPTVAEWLAEFGITTVYFGRGIGNTNTRKEITNIFTALNIEQKSNLNFFSDDIGGNSVMIQHASGAELSPTFKGKRICKQIILVNSRPVDIK